MGNIIKVKVGFEADVTETDFMELTSGISEHINDAISKLSDPKLNNISKVIICKNNYDQGFDELWSDLVTGGYFTEEELRLVTDVAGNTVSVLKDAIYSRYGFRDYDQLKESTS